MRKLTPEQVQEIRDDDDLQYGYIAKAARKYSVSSETISRVLRGRGAYANALDDAKARAKGLNLDGSTRRETVMVETRKEHEQ